MLSSPENAGTVATPDSWVDEHGDCLYRYALVRVRTPEVAQDLVQESFLAALRSQGQFAGRSFRAKLALRNTEEQDS